jgi:hypothetical protein
MHLSVDIEKGALGDWAYRIGRTMAWCMFGIAPVHFFVPCSVSATTMAVAAGLGLVVVVLSIIARRLGLFAMAFGAFVLHILCVH